MNITRLNKESFSIENLTKQELTILAKALYLTSENYQYEDVTIRANEMINSFEDFCLDNKDVRTELMLALGYSQTDIEKAQVVIAQYQLNSTETF